jgi:cytochrome c peroxidase
MRNLRIFSRVRSMTSSTRGVGPHSIAVALIAMLVLTGVAVGVGLSIFRPFKDDSGVVQSAPSDVVISTSAGSVVPVSAPLDDTNKFFDPGFGTNGQACVSCHQPSLGFTIDVGSIQSAFKATGLTDPLFRLNDTANNPNGSNSADNFSLFMDTGVVRIGKTFAASSDFTVAPQNTTKFGPLPLSTDPQQPGHTTLSLFRRPLVNTNVHLDSSVLWDGRASIGNIRAQVIGAAKTLLLAPNPTNDDSDQVAAFMLGVYTDQRFDTAAGTDAEGNCFLPTCGGGLLDADGALGGVDNLRSLALGPNAPCTSFLANPCTTNVAGYSIFDAWSNLPSETARNAARATIARGQDVFNNVNLTIPADGIPGLSQTAGTVIHCTTCHATGNVGNNPDATFFVRIGTDSVQILNALGNRVAGLAARAQNLPEYCLRPTSDPTPFSTAACGTHGTDVRTTDPGRAMVTGHIADVGKFKPPILRGLTVRSPYFHAGVADGIDALVDFYNARFSIALTDEQHSDLVAFLEAQ